MPAYYHDTPIDVPDGSWVRFDSDSGGTPAAVFSRAGQPIANSVVFSQTGSVQRVLSDSATLFLRLSSQAGVARSGVVAQTSGVAFTSFDSDSDVTGRGGAGGGSVDLSAYKTSAQSDAAYAPRWQTNTAYTAGQAVLLPDGTVGTAKTGFTSGSSFDTSNWNVSTASGATIDDTTTSNTKVLSSSKSVSATMTSVFQDRGSIERETSRQAHVVQYTDSAEITEQWADLSAWAGYGAGSLVVSGGKVYGAAGTAPAGATRPLPIAAGSNSRLVGSIVVPATPSGGAAAQAVIGYAKQATPPADNHGTIVGLGVDASTHYPVACFGSTVTNLATTALAAGTYYVIGQTGPNGYISLTLLDAAHTVEFKYTVLRPWATPYGIQIWNGDTRGSGSGLGIGPVGLKQGTLATLRTRTNIEGQAHTIYRTTDPNAQNTWVGLPKTWDSRKSMPLVLFSHGAGEHYDLPWTGTDPRAVFDALLNAGFMVVSNELSGDHWGNQAGQDALLASYRWARDNYPVGPVVLFGRSMGGLVTLNALAARTIPGVVGWVGSNPVCSLANLYGLGTFAGSIRAAYGVASDGSDYAAKTAGFDPALKNGDVFRSVPMHFVSSPSDNTVPKAANTDIVQAKVAPFTSEASITAATGAHGDPSSYPASDIVAFCQRVTAA